MNLTVRTRKNGGLRAIGVVGRLRLCLGAERSVGRSAGCAGPAGGTGPSDVAHRAGQLRGTDVPSTSGRARPAGITVQQSSSNRLALGIGLSHKPVIETGFGLSFSHPIRHLREYLTVLTPLLAGRAVQMSGQHYRVQQEPSVPPGVKPPPVLVAALGPQMLRLAGELRTRKNGDLRAIGVVGRLRLCLGAERSVGRPPDALVLLGALGPVTSCIELGSYVVPTFPRHPAVLAQQASPFSSRARTGSRSASA